MNRSDASVEESLDIATSAPTDAAGGGCATASFEAQQAPAALLAILDRSGSMASNNKFSFAANAIVQALDQDVFDSMWVGLYATPSPGKVPGPQCILGYPVACGNVPFPQVDLALAGDKKSVDGSGVRHTIKSKINSLLPDAMDPDASPMYEALQNALLNLQSWPKKGKRILFVVTDGSFSCTSLSQPQRSAYEDQNMCLDWEDPSNIISLVSKANKDANTPIETFFVGVPGADTYDPRGYQYPPYHMRLALSAMAYAGSPSNVPATCTGKMYSQNGGDPAKSCHIDLTQQGAFSAKAVADAITQIRGKVLGCVFELPQPDGGTINMDEVNVSITVAGAKKDLYRRKDPSNMCVNDGCWDYDGNGKVVLIGNACDQVGMGTDAKVEIVVGCSTVIQ